MAFTFRSFAQWKEVCLERDVPLYQPVLDYEYEEKGNDESVVFNGLSHAFSVMTDAVQTGLTEEMKSRSGMVQGGAKKVHDSNINVLTPEFRNLVARSLAAKEVNSCMGRVVAAPTAGASGILPGVLVTLKEIHQTEDRVISECLLIAAGIGLIIEQRASLAGAVGGCQAETGAAAAMASGAVVYALGGSIDQIFNAVAITIQCMLGLVCDPVAGLVEVPCIVRNASAAAIANSSAQIALSHVSSVIPVDECVDAMGEVGQSMEDRYKETAMGGLAATPTGQAISKSVLIQDIEILPDQDSSNPE